MCGNREDAEDVLIEALLKAYRSLGQLEDEGAFRAWLAQIARRACGRLKKKEALIPVIGIDSMEGFDVVDAGPTPDQEVQAAQLKNCLQHGLEQLPRHYREVYELKDLDGMTIEQVASRLGISVANVKARLHRARIRLRELIDGSLAA